MEQGRRKALEERNKEMDERLARLRDMVERLEGARDDGEAIDLLEEAVTEVENYGNKLEEEGR